MSNKDSKEAGSSVHHPTHYNACGELDSDKTVPFEPIKVIESWGYSSDFCMGNALKYILRASHKDSIREDLEKARWYLCRDTCHRKRMLPSDVSEAWGLPKNLQRAVESIALGMTFEAAEAISKHLEEIG